MHSKKAHTDIQISKRKKLRCITESDYVLSWKEPFKAHLDQGPCNKQGQLRRRYLGPKMCSQIKPKKHAQIHSDV